MSKKIIFVTGYKDKARSTEFENLIKSLYLSKDDPENHPCLTFFHENSDNVKIANKAKEKRATAIVFDTVHSVTRITTIQKMIKNRMNGSSPEMIHTGIRVNIGDVLFMDN